MNEIDYVNGYVQICVSCCKLNQENSKTLPMICPQTNMPCFAINPKYLIPTPSMELVSFIEGFNMVNKSDKPRLPINCKYIDENFVSIRCKAFDELASKGNKTIYTMEAF